MNTRRGTDKKNYGKPTTQMGREMSIHPLVRD